MDGLLDFFSADEGRKRREARDQFVGSLVNGLLGPTGIPERLGLLSEIFNPVVGVEQAGSAARTVANPDASWQDRVGAGGRMASEIAGVVAPAAAVRFAGIGGDDAARALEEGLLGVSASPGAVAGRDFAMDEAGGTNLNPLTFYHGTPDAREIDAAGGFQPRTQTVRRAKNADDYEALQRAVGDATPGTKEYFRRLDAIGGAVEDAKIRSPIFFTDNRTVASTYADDTRAFDYQNAEPRIIEAKTSPQNVLDVYAGGENFRGIRKDRVKKALVDSGVSEQDANEALRRYIFGRDSDKMSTDDLAAIAQEFGFDAVDVARVRDNYFGAGPASTVRMVFDENLISIIKKYGIAGAAAMLGMSAEDLQAQADNQGLLGPHQSSAGPIPRADGGLLQ